MSSALFNFSQWLISDRLVYRLLSGRLLAKRLLSQRLGPYNIISDRLILKFFIFQGLILKFGCLKLGTVVWFIRLVLSNWLLFNGFIFGKFILNWWIFPWFVNLALWKGLISLVILLMITLLGILLVTLLAIFLSFHSRYLALRSCLMLRLKLGNMCDLFLYSEQLTQLFLVFFGCQQLWYVRTHCINVDKLVFIHLMSTFLCDWWHHRLSFYFTNFVLTQHKIATAIKAHLILRVIGATSCHFSNLTLDHRIGVFRGNFKIHLLISPWFSKCYFLLLGSGILASEHIVALFLTWIVGLSIVLKFDWLLIGVNFNRLGCLWFFLWFSEVWVGCRSADFAENITIRWERVLHYRGNFRFEYYNNGNNKTN